MKTTLISLTTLFLPSLALAHSGHDTPFGHDVHSTVSSFFHSLTSSDYLMMLALLAVLAGVISSAFKQS